jgi:hypothetical protein
MLGIPQIDHEMRGISPGHLAIITGYAHSGKTLLTSQVVHRNHDKRIIWFTPDETESLVFIKLASLVSGIPARELEARVHDGDPFALRVLDQVEDEFPDLIIVHAPLTPRLLREATGEAHDMWGATADLVIIDYLDLMRGQELASKADAIKAYGTEHDVPVWCLHQTSRSAGSNGRPMRIDSGAFGGETWATFQLGVWRRKSELMHQISELEAKENKAAWQIDRIEMLRYELRVHEFTVTVNLTKNKRPGGRTLEDGIDFELFADSGQLRQLNGDLPEQYRRGHHLHAIGGTW